MTVRRLGPADAAYFSADRQSLSVTLLRFSPRPDGSVPAPEEIIAVARHVLTRADASPALRAARQRARRVPGNLARPFWEDDPEFDARRHVYVHDASRVGTRPRDIVLDAMSRPLDLERPLWRVEIVPSLDGTDDFGLLGAQHHALGEGGWSFAALAQLVLSLTPEVPQVDDTVEAWRPSSGAPSGRALGTALTEGLSSVIDACRSGARAAGRRDPGAFAGETARIASYFHERSVQRSRWRQHDGGAGLGSPQLHEYRLSLLETRVASRAFATTITDLLLAAVGAAWSAVDPEATDAWIAMPVSLRETGDQSATNRFGLASVSVPCGQDLLTTLRAAQNSSSRAKQYELARTSADLALLRSHVPHASRHGPWGRVNPQLLLSNMPGFPFELYCHGAPLRDALAASPLAEGLRGKLTFVTFGEWIHGTLLEATGPGGVGTAFDRVFRESLDELCRIAANRNLLARQPHFMALSPAHLDELTRLSKVVSFRPGDEIVTQGDPATCFYVVRSGSATVSVDGAQRSVIGAGAGFGEVGLVRGEGRQATVTAAEPVEALCIDGASFHAVFGSDPVNAQPLGEIVANYESDMEE